MLQSLEILLLKGIEYDISLEWIFGIPLIIAALAFLAIQFIKKQNTVLPGLIALSIFFIEGYHIFNSDEAVRFIQGLLTSLQTPLGSATQFSYFGFILEPLFSFFVAPLGYRHFHEEIIFVFFLTYFIFVCRHSWNQYKVDGVILGDVSITSHFSADTSARPTRSEDNELGSGDLASTDMIAQWTKKSGDKGDTILPATELRGAEGVAFKSADLIIPREQRNRHILTIATVSYTHLTLPTILLV